jgi:peptidyl-prolyl cis-trans isomerase D
MALKNDKQQQPSSGDREPKTRHGNPFVYFGTIAILVITIIAFVVAPSLGSGMGEGDTLSFGSWDGKSIAFAQGSYFAEQVQAVKTQLESQGYSDTGDQFFAYQVWRRAFENTAIHMALLSEAQASGIAVSNSFLDEQMASHPAFIEDGAFSRRRFREATTAVKAGIRTEIRESALKERYVADAVSILPSTAEKDFIKNMAQPERAIEYVAFPFSAYPDSARLDFARANAALFNKTSLSKVTITSNAKEASEILAKVRGGTLSFEDAAKNYSKDQYASRGGDMGERYAWELKADFKDASALDAVVALGSGAVSEVYETSTGSWSFYKANQAAAQPDFGAATLLSSAADYINRFEKGLVEDYFLKSAADFASAAGSDFSSAAASRSLTVKSTASFPLNYGGALDLGYFSLINKLDTTNNPELNGADRNEAFLLEVFSLGTGELSKPLVLNDNVLVFRVAQISGAEESSLGLIEAYYPSVLQESLSRDLASGIMKNPKLKDNFLDTFLRVFANSN